MKTLPNFCRSFQEEAAQVWNDMSDAADLDISRGEVTTTETLLLRLARKHNERGLTIKSYTATEERNTGADWGFWFKPSNPGGAKVPGIGIRVQAKILHRKSCLYEQLYHPFSEIKSSQTKGKTQCDVLLNRYRDDKLIPLYVFYNSDVLFKPAGTTAHAKMARMRRIKDLLKAYPFPSPEWGISAASALAVKKARSGQNNCPGDFPMVPWHCLVCSDFLKTNPGNLRLPALIGQGLKKLFNMSSSVSAVAASKISFRPHTKTPNWVSFLDKSSLDDVPIPEQEVNKVLNDAGLMGITVVVEGEATND